MVYKIISLYFYELFKNSSDAISKTKIDTLKIRIRLKKEGTKYIATFSDNAGGIPKLVDKVCSHQDIFYTGRYALDQEYIITDDGQVIKQTFAGYLITDSSQAVKKTLIFTKAEQIKLDDCLRLFRANKNDKVEDGLTMGGGSIGTWLIYHALVTRSDPDVSMLWKNEGGGVAISFISDKTCKDFKARPKTEVPQEALPEAPPLVDHGGWKVRASSASSRPLLIQRPAHMSSEPLPAVDPSLLTRTSSEPFSVVDQAQLGNRSNSAPSPHVAAPIERIT